MTFHNPQFISRMRKTLHLLDTREAQNFIEDGKKTLTPILLDLGVSEEDIHWDESVSTGRITCAFHSYGGYSKRIGLSYDRAMQHPWADIGDHRTLMIRGDYETRIDDVEISVRIIIDIEIPEEETKILWAIGKISYSEPTVYPAEPVLLCQ